MDTEEWSRMPGAEATHLVSSLGRVWSIPRWRPLRGTVANHGYRVVNVGPQGQRCVHRLVGEAFLGPCPEGWVMRHLNGDKLDNRVENLCWGTQRENLLDIVAHGRHSLASRTRCPRKHPLALPNLVASEVKKGHRSCLACSRARGHVQQAQRSGRAVPDLDELADLKYTAIMSGARRSPRAD